jgi:nicotinamidase-related amidase
MRDDLREDYARAGFGRRLGWGDRPAVVAVDWCRAYLDPTSPLYAGAAGEAAALTTARVVDVARAAGLPVLFTRVEFSPGDSSVFYRKVPALRCFDRGSPLADWPIVPAALTPQAHDIVITKTTASAFSGTDLAARLRSLRIDTIVICGVSTSGCVRATAVDACQLDFIPIVVRDAVADRGREPHEANLFDLDAKYADVLPSSDVIAHFRAGGRS